MWFFSEEERQLQEVVREFAKNELGPKAEHHDETETFNIEAFKKMGELGLLGITADPEYGGSGLGATAATIVMEELGKVCASSTLSYLAHAILCVNNIFFSNCRKCSFAYYFTRKQQRGQNRPFKAFFILVLSVSSVSFSSVSSC